MALADVPVALIESCRRGERHAVEELLRLISPDIYRIIFSMLRDHEQTDEVVQETMIRLFRYVHRLKDPERFAPWAMRIAVNQVQTFRLKRGRDRLVAFEDGMPLEENVVVVAGGRSTTPREEAQRREVMDQIEQAMAGLPDRQQMAVTLFEIEGCSIKEIAQAMSCSEGAVKFNIHEARKKLQRRLGHLAQGLTRKAQQLGELPRRRLSKAE